ncbi:MAG TPA: LamG domain-containing protein, partial [Chthonomonadaceae bacterium]|nr:LamG domain-containing protein [Chthonomonadaceae bacterium]
SQFLIQDRTFTLSGRPVRLSQVRNIEHGPPTLVTMTDGQVLQGLVQGLEAVPTIVLGNPIRVNLGQASLLTVTNEVGAEFPIAYHLVARQGDRVLGEQSGTLIVLTGNASARKAPIGWWRGEGNAWDAIGGHHGWVSRGVSYGPGVQGQAFVFDGVQGGIRLPDTGKLQLTGSFTIDVWIQAVSFPERQNNYGMILFRGDDRAGWDPYFLGLQFDGQLHFRVTSETNTEAEIAAPIPLEKWVHVTASLDAEGGKLRLYLDHKLAAELKTSVRPFRDLDPAANPGICIGNSSGFPNSKYNYPFHGSIDELKVYDYVVSP